MPDIQPLAAQMSEEPNPYQAPQADLPLQWERRPLIGKVRRWTGITVIASSVVTCIIDAPHALRVKNYHTIYVGVLMISVGSLLAFGARVGLLVFVMLAICVVAALVVLG